MTNALLAPSARPNSPAAADPGLLPVHRLVLVDPREDRRAIMNFLVGQCPRLIVVGLAASLEDARSQIQSEQADVAVVEIQMPVAEGLMTIGALRDEFVDLRIVVCSFMNDSAVRDEARLRGADGYLSKPLRATDLLRLVEAPTLPQDDGGVPGHP